MTYAYGALAMLAAIGLYRARWVFDPRNWKRGKPWLGGPRGSVRSIHG